MKIALLSEKYTPDIGGLAISAERLAQLLASASHQVHVFALTSSLPPSEIQTLSSKGISIRRFGAHKRPEDTLLDWFELIVREHQRDPFDLLHAYFLTQAGFIATYAGNFLNVPSVVSARGNDLERAIFDAGRAAHILFALQHADAVTTNSNELARKARALAVPGLDIRVIPNGIDTEHFRPLPRNNALAQSLSLITEGKDHAHLRVIGFAGELREKKGLRPLLSSYAQINEKRPTTLLIVGDVRAGEDGQIFEEFRQLHTRARIIVTGYVSRRDLPAYYSLMDVFVQPSLRDGLPNALLEAMACGKPVVATRAGGIVDAITDCENGRLVSTNNVDELAQTVEELLDDESQRTRIGYAACQTIRKHFTLEKELDLNLDVYRSLGLKI